MKISTILKFFCYWIVAIDFFYFDRFGPEYFRAARDNLLEIKPYARAAATNMAF